MIFQQATFLKSAAAITQCPADVGCEVAWVGRSNAGKSSVLNTLCHQKKLARTSKEPGRTRLLNYFTLDKEASQRLVDLPGYGYAKVSQAMRKEWDEMIDNYLSHRQSLKLLILVMDIRHPMQAFDWQILHWSIDAKMPLHLILTKSDKLSRGAATNTLLSVMKPHQGNPLISGQTFSSLKKEGVETLTKKLASIFLS